MDWLRERFPTKTLRQDSVAGLVLGVESIPDGLAAGLLAGVNPLYGLYGYLFGTVSAALFTSSQFMVVQATGAMGVVVSDIPAVHGGEDPNRALFTLTILTGLVMVAAGFLKLGQYLKFVPNSVIVGFISAVGVNIVLGQLDDFTGYEAEGANRLGRAWDLVTHPLQINPATIGVGLVTVALILWLERTRIGALGMVLAIVLGSALVPIFGLEVEVLSGIVSVPGSLPLPILPDLTLVPVLLLGAVSLAFVGLIQGAAISASLPNADGSYPDADQDFVGQGAANLVTGLFQGMPVGGSMSATMISRSAGGRSRMVQLIAGMVMAVGILLFADLVELIAMPALAGLLIVVGVRTVKPNNLAAVWKTGRLQAVALTTTFVLTILIPLQYAVLVGVGVAMLLTIVRQSEQMELRRILTDDEGIREVPPPKSLPPGEVVILQPYGSLFFATASAFEHQLPAVGDESARSVVIVRLRGRTELGSTLADLLGRYGQQLAATGSRLFVVSDNERVRSQLEVAGVIDTIGEDAFYESNEWLGRTVRRAAADAQAWIDGGT